MIEFLMALALAVVTAAVPVISAFLIRLINRKSDEVESNTNSTTVQLIINEARNAVTSAVSYTSQTYVDALKADGTFGGTNAKVAFETALTRTKLMLTDSAKHTLAALYGDVDEWLATLIEQAVKQQKE